MILESIEWTFNVFLITVQICNVCRPNVVNMQSLLRPTILDKTVETIPANITKLLNIDKTNVFSPSHPPVQCCEQRRNNFW